jgi:hypothetical protein
MLFNRSIAAALIALSASAAQAGYLTGTITDITSTPDGLMLKLSTGLPADCTGSPYNWMLVPEQYKTIIVTTLGFYLGGMKTVTVYSVPTTNFYCKINQIDPVE